MMINFKLNILFIKQVITIFMGSISMQSYVMRKTVYILVLALCYSLSSCRSQKEAGIAPITENPYLTHYLPSASDSISGRQQTAPNGGKHNLEQMRENINPETDGIFGDLLRNILESIFSKKH